MLSRAQGHLQNVLQRITATAVKRMLDGRYYAQLYDKDEEVDLRNALKEVWGTSYLFGRSQVQLRAGQSRAANERGEKFRSSDPTNLVATFGDNPLPLFSVANMDDDYGGGGNNGGSTEEYNFQPRKFADEPTLYPKAALDYFMGLVPSLNTNVERFGELLERKSFTLAAATTETVLDRVQKVVGEFNEAFGHGKDGMAGRINEILDAVGITPKNPQYGAMVARTNVMDGLNTGTQREQWAVRDTFPAWKYSSIAKKQGSQWVPRDGRTRPTHAARNGMVFSVSIPFTEVRGTEIKDVANCRCVPIPMDKWELEEFLAKGGKLQEDLSEVPQ